MFDDSKMVLVSFDGCPVHEFGQVYFLLLSADDLAEPIASSEKVVGIIKEKLYVFVG